MKNNELPLVIVDGQTLVNKWDYLMELGNCTFLLSVSNFILANDLFKENLRILKDHPDKFDEYLDKYVELGLFVNSTEQMKAVENFVNTNEAFMEAYPIDEENNTFVALYQGAYEEIESGVDDFMNEAVALLKLTRDNGEAVPLMTMNEDLADYAKNKYPYLEVIRIDI